MTARKVVFIGLNLDKDNRRRTDNLETLVADKKIAIRYKNIPSTNPNKYDKYGKTSLKLLQACCKSGAIVCALFSKLKPPIMLLGNIEKGRSRVVAEEFPADFKPKCKDKGKVAYYKTVQLNHKKVQEIPKSDRRYIVLSTLQPRQKTIEDYTKKPKESLYSWAARTRIMAVFKGQNHKGVTSLLPSQLEVLCYEYLKEEKILDVILLPIGRTLRDVDIWGLGKKNKEVFAQVTFSDEKQKIQKKMARLKECGDENSIRFFFGPQKGKRYVAKSDKKLYVPIEKVFNALQKSPKQKYKRMIREMLRVT